jgi:hypothetical protein
MRSGLATTSPVANLHREATIERHARRHLKRHRGTVRAKVTGSPAAPPPPPPEARARGHGQLTAGMEAGQGSREEKRQRRP